MALRRTELLLHTRSVLSRRSRAVVTVRIYFFTLSALYSGASPFTDARSLRHFASKASSASGSDGPGSPRGDGLAESSTLWRTLPGRVCWRSPVPVCACIEQSGMWAQVSVRRAFLGGQRETGTKTRISGQHGRKGKPGSFSFSIEIERWLNNLCSSPAPPAVSEIKKKTKGSRPGFSMERLATWT